jgi:hypothetical protein
MKKSNSLKSTKRLVLDRETLSNLSIGGGRSYATYFAPCRTVGQNCLTTSCGVDSCNGCGRE